MELLIVEEGGSPVRRAVALEPWTTSLGRCADVSVTLQDPLVSRRHALIQRTPTGIFLQDLGSTNGVVVDGVRVPPLGRARLQHGAEIRFAATRILIREPEIPRADRPTPRPTIECRVRIDDMERDRRLLRWVGPLGLLAFLGSVALVVVYAKPPPAEVAPRVAEPAMRVRARAPRTPAPHAVRTTPIDSPQAPLPARRDHCPRRPSASIWSLFRGVERPIRS